MCKVEFENCFVIFYSVFISCSFCCKYVFAHSISVIECNVEEGERSCDACRKCTFAFYIFFLSDGITRAFHLDVEFREMERRA